MSVGRQSSLGLFTLSSESSHGSWVISDVNSGLLKEVGGAVLDDFIVEVFSTQVSVTSGGLDLEDTVFNSQERDIEGSSSKIEDEDILLHTLLLVQTVSDGGGGWLVDDSEHVQISDVSGILGGLSLGIVEVGRDSDDCVLDGVSKIGLSSLFHLGQDHG